MNRKTKASLTRVRITGKAFHGLNQVILGMLQRKKIIHASPHCTGLIMQVEVTKGEVYYLVKPLDDPTTKRLKAEGFRGDIITDGLGLSTLELGFGVEP